MWKELDYEKVAIIGDVHGHFNTLNSLLAKIPKDYKIIYVGDLIDKGKRSRDVIQGIIDRKEDSVLGNHDIFMIQDHKPYWKRAMGESNSWTVGNGGIATQRSYGGKRKIRYLKDFSKVFYEHRRFLVDLPGIIHLPKIKVNNKEVFISHAPIDNIMDRFSGLEDIKIKLAKEHPMTIFSVFTDKIDFDFEPLFWGDRSLSSLKKIDTNYFNVFGHINVKEALVTDSVSALATNIENEGKLTALLLPDKSLISQDYIEDTWQFKKS